MDGPTGIKPEMLISGSEEVSRADAKKVMSAAKLAELALIDPKRAKRIWANRQSAARSKERKMRYIAELERKVHTLQTEATTLSAQLTLLQRETSGLTAENSELKLRLQTLEQQVHLQDALNEALKPRNPGSKGKHDKPKPWDEDPSINHWKIDRFDPFWNETGLLEVSSFSALFPKYKEKYLQEAWPSVKSALSECEVTCELNLVDGSMTVSTTRKIKDLKYRESVL
ncbi:hypothetical protein MLD38_006952 [Melastoma candidum]|uniref:Uncharacterized protein n=1 Tax=Melastoma candidum TaxID=119954 RepID=A0ACB9RPJ6_9MYRT|nr:hypothetical protein MLD38_006952 [Melastoma candidum]